MVITAPMKAGKSTIINALIGQEVMPVHSDAMTTLPGEVVFDSTLAEPVLTLSPDTFSAFKTAISTLQKKIDSQNIEWAKETTKAYAHLEDLLNKIISEIEVVEKTTGTEEIFSTLTELNHIIRLCGKLIPDYKPLQGITDFPRVETPFLQWNINSTEINTNLIQGKLVIVDTPGANEAGQHGLKHLVKAQLKNSSLVLVVLDFTALRSQEAAKIRDEVKEVIALRDKKNLYVVVNKIDAREEDNNRYLNSEQVREFVKHEFGLSDENQVFEISGKWAFCATSVLQELQVNPHLSIDDLRNLPKVITFAKQFYGHTWKKQLSLVSKEELESQAKELWISSGFATLLEQVIALLPMAEHHCMRTAMNIGSKSLGELYNIPLLIDKVKESYDKLG